MFIICSSVQNSMDERISQILSRIRPMNIIPFQAAMNSVMYKLAELVIFLLFFSAHVVKALKDVDNHLSEKESAPQKVCLADVSKDTLWVLDLDDDQLDFKQLKTADKMDWRAFREVMEPAIKNYEYLQLAKKGNERFTKTKSLTNLKAEINTEEITKYDVKKQIRRVFNKLVMYFSDEPSVDLHSGENNKLSFKLYFKGPFTSLVVRYKNQRWNYFIDPPSSLPRWFYEKHTNVTESGKISYVDIPESVRHEFYGKFFHLLNLFIGYAL